jgi:hypothetical protein
MGIMLWFRFAMIQSEPASNSRTISTQGHASRGRETMIEFLGLAFAPVATILSFIAGNRGTHSADTDQVLSDSLPDECSRETCLAGEPTAKPHWMLLQRIEISLRGLQVGGFKALAEAIVHRLQ